MTSVTLPFWAFVVAICCTAYVVGSIVAYIVDVAQLVKQRLKQ